MQNEIEDFKVFFASQCYLEALYIVLKSYEIIPSKWSTTQRSS